MSIPKEQPCEWCVGVWIALMVLSLVAVLGGGIFLTGQMLPQPCARIADRIPIAGDCR